MKPNLDIQVNCTAVNESHAKKIVMFEGQISGSNNTFTVKVTATAEYGPGVDCPFVQGGDYQMADERRGIDYSFSTGG